MTNGEKYNPKEPITPPENFIALDQILAKNIAEEVFEDKISDIKERIEQQSTISWGIVVGVAIAFVLDLGVVIFEHVNSRNLH